MDELNGLIDFKNFSIRNNQLNQLLIFGNMKLRYGSCFEFLGVTKALNKGNCDFGRLTSEI